MDHEGDEPMVAAGSPRPAAPLQSARRVGVARVLAVVGVVVYNWWVVIPFLAGWLSSLDGFFSDLSADGQAHAIVLRRLDLVAAALILVALLLRGPDGPGGPRREWRWLVAFAAFGLIGARFPYACAEGLDKACRAAERHLDLAPHHYVHMASGIAEFATATVAIWLAYRRTRGEQRVVARVAHALVIVLVVAYPLLGVAYLGDRLGSLIEPVFFVTFSAIVLIEVFEPSGPGPLPAGVRSR